MGGGYHGGFGKTKGAFDDVSCKTPAVKESGDILSEKMLISELEKSGAKFTRENIVFVTKDKSGQIIWLEKGSPTAGLEHILNGNEKSSGHTADFEKAFNISRENIPSFIKRVVSEGTIISNSLKVINGRQGYERIYYYKGKYCMLTGIGTNGFIVSAYPVEY